MDIKILLRILSLLLCIGMTPYGLHAQTEVIPLWPNGVPNAISDPSYTQESQLDALGNIRGYSNVSEPDITVFLAEKEISNGTSVVICPGGGYSHLAILKEGYKVAKWFNTLGISAFVLKYRMPSDQTMDDKSVGPLQDAQEAVRMVRRNATKWRIDPSKVGIMGFSAGGHLAASLSTLYNENTYTVSDNMSARPDFSILIYPVIAMEDGITHKGSQKNLLGDSPSPELLAKFSSEKQINKETPPAFLVHATDDAGVPVENSIAYYLALKKHKVASEMHIYDKGGHGFGLGIGHTNKYWPTACENWLRSNGWIPDEEIFLFSYFKGNGEDGLHLAYSEDGYTWKSLKNDASFLTPEVGKDKLMRDPCIIKGGDGKYHMVWTVSWTDRGIGHAYSEDLIHWSEQQFIPVMAYEKSARNTWAPELTYDPESDTYLIYWASTIPGKFPETQSDKDDGYNHRMYYTSTKDFKTFSPTALLYEPGFNVIDATIQKQEDKFVMFLKDETREPAEKNIKIAHSDKLTGPYSKASDPITGDYWAEGPTAQKIDGKWTIYFDKYVDHTYGAVQSSDLKNWKDISNQIHFPKGTRHGTVFTVPRALFEKLKKQ